MKVIFRKFPDGQVIALLLGTEPDCNYGMIMSYMHVGQHGEADPGIVYHTALALPDEYAPLKAELESIYGETIDVRKRYRR